MIFVLTRPQENCIGPLTDKNFIFLPAFKYQDKNAPTLKYNHTTIFILTSQYVCNWIIKNKLPKTNTYYCVGETTAAILKKNGFVNIYTPPISTVENLITFIKQRHHGDQHYVYLAGKMIKTPLHTTLNKTGLSCMKHIVYETEAINHPLKKILIPNQNYGFIFYSIQTYKLFMNNLRQENMVQICENSSAIFVLPHRTKGFVFNLINDIKWKKYDVFHDTQDLLQSLGKHIN
jgi:uroporphyrinogen-III synthase